MTRGIRSRIVFLAGAVVLIGVLVWVAGRSAPPPIVEPPSIPIPPPVITHEETPDTPSTPPPSDEAPAGVGSVSGTVRFESTGEPAKGVVVEARVRVEAVSRTTTDEEGAYCIEGLPAGTELAVFARGEDVTWAQAEIPVVTPKADEATTGVDILLAEGGTIRGKVSLLETGEPMADIRLGADLSGQWMVFDNETQSSANGVYEIRGLVPGHYYVHAYPPDTVVREFRRGSRLSRQTVHVELGTGEVAEGMDFLFQLGARVLGRTVNRSGHTIEGTTVTAGIYLNNSYLDGEAISGTDGSFIIEHMLPGSECELAGSAKGYCRVLKRVALPADGADTRVDLVFDKASAVSGRVVDTRTRPVPSASVVMFRRPGRDEFVEFRSEESKTDSEGRFSFDSLPFGVYGFDVQGAKSAETGAVYHHKPLTPFIELEVGETLSNVEVVVVAEDRLVEGLVHDAQGRPISDVTVTVSGDVGSSGATKTDPGGRFRIGTAGVETTQVSFHHPDYADAYIQVAAETGNLNVTLEAPAEIAGTVVDAVTGQPVENCYAEIRQIVLDDGVGAAHESFGTRKREDLSVGEFGFTGVTPGTVTLLVMADGFVKQEVRDITVEGGRVNQVQVPLYRGGMIEGEILLGGYFAGQGGHVSIATAHLETASQLKDIVTTDADASGRYEFAELAEGSYVVLASYSAPSDRLEMRQTRDALVERDKVTRVEFQFSGTGVIEGQVVSPGASGVFLRAGSASAPLDFDDDIFVRLDTIGTASLGEDGRYRFEGIPAGTYTLTTLIRDESGTSRQMSQMVSVGQGEAVQVDLPAEMGEGASE
ncbi:MAG: carboxypeptidase regulatory-like domain-containing protein [bacterium]|nr:carboxypeptidase regulatory-like domain-containing protein [bacterium]